MLRNILLTGGRWLLIWIAIIGLCLMGADGGPDSIWPWNILIGAVMFFGPMLFAMWWYDRNEYWQGKGFRGNL